MAKFVLVYTGGAMAAPEEQAAIMAAWGAWFGQLGAALVDGGQPFTPVARTIQPEGKVTDGVEGIPATGYSIIQADSLDEAVALAKGCPQLHSGGAITVYEGLPVM